MHVVNFTPMKYILFAVVGISLLWKLSFNGWNFLAVANPFDVSNAMWGVATLYVCDFTAAMFGKNSPYMKEFYDGLKRDFAVSVIWGATLFIVLYRVPAQYSFSSLDVASFGMPLLIYSFFALIESATIKIFKQHLSRRLVFILVALLCGSYLYFAYLLIEIGDNSFSPSKSLWYQITILTTSFAAFIGSNFIKYVLVKQRLEVSPVLLRLFDGLPSASGQYRLTAEMAVAWNRHLDELKEKERKEAVLARKAKRKKRK